MNGLNLKLVVSDTSEASNTESGPESIGDQSTATGRLFARWVWMMNKNPKRCALGPKRVKVMAEALKLYDEDTLSLANDGCAASAWHAGANDRGREFNDIELIFRDEAHIERFAAEGQELHDRLEREEAEAMRRRAVGAEAPMSEARRLEVSTMLRDLAIRLRSKAGR